MTCNLECQGDSNLYCSDICFKCRCVEELFPCTLCNGVFCKSHIHKCVTCEDVDLICRYCSLGGCCKNCRKPCRGCGIEVPINTYYCFSDSLTKCSECNKKTCYNSRTCRKCS